MTFERALALQLLSQRGEAYSREIAVEVVDITGETLRVAVPRVSRELRSMEAEGLVVGENRPGPTMMRRYYRMRGEQ